MTKQLQYSFLLSLLFLFIHIVVLFLNLNEGLNFIVILSAMILTQLMAFSIIRRKSNNKLKTFSSIFILLSVTQLFSVILLTIFSAFDPFRESKPFHLSDVLTSIVLFVLLLPLLVASAIWFTKGKKIVME